MIAIAVRGPDDPGRAHDPRPLLANLPEYSVDTGYGSPRDVFRLSTPMPQSHHSL